QRLAGPSQAVIAPPALRRLFQVVHRLQIARLEKRNEEFAHWGHVVDGDNESGRARLPDLHAVDDVAGGAIVGLREIELCTSFHLREAEVLAGMLEMGAIESRGVRDKSPPAGFRDGPIAQALKA